MPDPNRPFQHYSEAELFDRKSQLREAYQYHSGRLKGMSRVDDDRKAINDEISNIGREQNAIQEELAARRKKREKS
jgi:50S ribosomal subunit-associated GTPase HflX